MRPITRPASAFHVVALGQWLQVPLVIVTVIGAYTAEDSSALDTAARLVGYCSARHRTWRKGVQRYAQSSLACRRSFDTRVPGNLRYSRSGATPLEASCMGNYAQYLAQFHLVHWQQANTGSSITPIRSGFHPVAWARPKPGSTLAPCRNQTGRIFDVERRAGRFLPSSLHTFIGGSGHPSRRPRTGRLDAGKTP